MTQNGHKARHGCGDSEKHSDACTRCGSNMSTVNFNAHLEQRFLRARLAQADAHLSEEPLAECL